MDEREAWAEFLNAAGTLHIVAELGIEPRRYTDLEESVPVSSSTLAARLEEGVRLDAWQLDRIVDEKGDRTVYRLESSGENVFNAMERNGGLEAARKVREHERTLADILELLIERLQDDE